MILSDMENQIVDLLGEAPRALAPDEMLRLKQVVELVNYHGRADMEFARALAYIVDIAGRALAAMGREDKTIFEQKEDG